MLDEHLNDSIYLFFLKTIQIQQRAERDAAIARLEQSRIILAMRLAEHRGKKYKVIEEALTFVGDVQDASRFIFPENLYGPPNGAGENLAIPKGNILMKVLLSSFNFAKNSLGLNHVCGILGNAALVAVTMMALLKFNQVTTPREHVRKPQGEVYSGNSSKKPSKLPKGILSKGSSGQLDVLLARG